MQKGAGQEVLTGELGIHEDLEDRQGRPCSGSHSTSLERSRGEHGLSRERIMRTLPCHLEPTL